jgi:thioredoxin-dependent peroxiredoxin
MLRILILALIVTAALAVVVPRLMSGSATPSIGSEAPNFTLPSQDGFVSLKDYRGKWVVLYFYPKDETPG